MLSLSQPVGMQNDLFWKKIGPAIFTKSRMQIAADEVTKIEKLLNLKPGLRVLDMACGVGRHALEFARRGYIVTGVDRIRGYLEEAKTQAESEGLDVEFIKADMRDFKREGAFDVCINMYSSFGYFEFVDEDKKVLDNMYLSLIPGGMLILDLVGKEVIARNFRERDWYEEDGVLLLQERKLAQNWSWIENRWITIKNNERNELTFGHRLYSASELTSLVGEAGYTGLSVYGELDGSEYGSNASRLVVTAVCS